MTETPQRDHTATLGCIAGMGLYAVVGVVGWLYTMLTVSYPEHCGTAGGQLTCEGVWQGRILTWLGIALAAGAVLGIVGGGIAEHRGKRPLWWIVGAWAVLVGAFVAASIVRDLPEPGRLGVQAQFDRLMSRPSLEQITARYERMQAEVRRSVREAVDLPPWQRSEGTVSGTSCDKPFGDMDEDAAVLFLAHWTTAAAIGEREWPEATTAMRQVLHRYDFRRDESGFFHDPYGGSVELGSGTQTVVSVDTGCHLYGEVKRRGTPTPEEPLY